MRGEKAITMSKKIKVLGTEIALSSQKKEDYFSLTDIARFKNPEHPADVIKNWTRSKDTIEFLGLWERINNPDFKLVEFDQFRNQAGSNSFVLSPQKWIESTNAEGIISKSGKYGGTFAHKDIAFEFASWISAEFKLYLIKEFQRLKEDENERLQLGWDIKRNLAKINYRIHTDAIKKHLVPDKISRNAENLIYASEADILNLALFGTTAKEWRNNNPTLDGNMRDYADVSQLVCLSNLENINALFIKEGMDKSKRLEKLNSIAIGQMTLLTKETSLKRLK
ncbi:MAG: KilA-N domain-containing protein [Candidatus Methanoperedens sp.]|nr:KilA-N domain-containing protein [Candidatus Methanoperedens sp.]